MAERRIVDKTGRGIVCFISNYSWLDGLSFTGMRERYLEAFDAIWIDCLNGDKYKTGKTTPDGEPDPSIFSTEHNREGIQVGTAIATLVRETEHKPASTVGFRHLWGANKRQDLLATRGSRVVLRSMKPCAATRTGFTVHAGCCGCGLSSTGQNCRSCCPRPSPASRPAATISLSASTARCLSIALFSILTETLSRICGIDIRP